MREILESHPAKNLKDIIRKMKTEVKGFSQMKKPELVNKILELKRKGFPVPKVEMYKRPGSSRAAAAEPSQSSSAKVGSGIKRKTYNNVVGRSADEFKKYRVPGTEKERKRKKDGTYTEFKPARVDKPKVDKAISSMQKKIEKYPDGKQFVSNLNKYKFNPGFTDIDAVGSLEQQVFSHFFERPEQLTQSNFEELVESRRKNFKRLRDSAKARSKK